jgi:carbon-monoxide dehydrogenase medium subunit
MHAFDYHRPSNLKEALALGAQKTEGRFLAGGQSLVQAMKLRLSSPTDLIDLGAIGDLKGLSVDANSVTIGAMVRHAEVAGSSAVQKTIPALAQLAGMIGDRQVRHMGTLGGSLANSDPAADYPAAVLGLGATIITNKRKIKADDFFKGMFETALAPDEIITASSFRWRRRRPTSSSATRPRAMRWSACLSPNVRRKCASRSPAPVATACSA